jgi:chromosome segregation ATPase
LGEVSGLSHDKVTVDEPLISTDVDQLIRTIAERKRIALNELRVVSRIDKKTMDKWIAVLEDEGYISVEYGLRGTYVIWSNSDAAAASAARAAEKAPVSPSPPQPSEPQRIEAAPQSEGQVAEAIEQDTHVEFREEVPMEEASGSQDAEAVSNEEPSSQEEAPQADDSEPEELLSQYLARKMKGESSDEDSIKSKILTNFGDKEEEIRPEPSEGPESSDARQEDDIQEEVPALSVRAKELIKPVQPRERVAAGDVREMMSSYVLEINKEKAKIDALKKEKEALYTDKFAVVEGKMQADLVTLTERIIEKQSKIAELKENVLELPDKVDELDRLQSQMDSLRKEGRQALSRVRSKADEYVASMESAKAEIEMKVDDVRVSLERQSSRVKDLESQRSSLETKSSKLRDALNSARAQMDELSASMNALSVDLQQVDQTKAEVESVTESVKESVSERGEELQSLEQELEGISQVERFTQEYIRDYAQKMDEVERYVAKSEDELSDLKEAAEQLYVKKYLGELENLSDAYESELSEGVSKESEIDQRIEESKNRINELARESQEMIKRLRGEVSGSRDYNSLAAKVKEKTSKVSRILEEKAAERSKLLDESRRTRKTKVVAKSSGKAKAKAVSKPSKRRK